MELLFLQDIVVIFALSILVILCCHRLKIPSIVGFLLTGVLVGPHGLRFIQDPAIVETFAEIGIVLLLFSIGMEFSLKKIFEYRRFFFIGGAIQVALTVLVVALAAFLFKKPPGEAIFLGFLIALSSTAIVLRVLDERSETDTPHGRLIVGIMIFQDIIAIPMMLLTPLLSGAGMELSQEILLRVGSGFLLLIAILATAHRMIPRLFFYIARTRSRELFLLSVLTLCFAVALLTSKIGLSLSLGAFLAGLLVSESEYRHEAVGDVLPFQDVFTSFFFVSIGMLLNVSFFANQPFTILLLTTGVLLLKVCTAGIAALTLRMPLRTAILTGVSLCQIGEFSFVLAKNGLKHSLVDADSYQMFLTVSLLSMGLTPLLISLGPQIVSLLSHLPLPAHLKQA